MSGDSSLPIGVMIIFSLLMLYIILGTFMEHKVVPLGHETGVALLAGLAVSAIIHYGISS